MLRFLILHSSGDPVVPVSQSRRFHEALTKAGVKSELKVYEAKGHSLPGSSKADMIRFLTAVEKAHLTHGGGSAILPTGE